MRADAGCLLVPGVGDAPERRSDLADYHSQIAMEHGIDRRGDFSLGVIKKICAGIGDSLTVLSLMMAVEERFLMNGVPERA